MSDIKVMIVDDHEIVRHGMCHAFQEEEGFRIIADTGSGRSAIELVSKLYPDIIIMDVAMPDLNGIETTRIILDRNPNIKILALSVYSEQVYVVGMFQAGASGYILKTQSFTDLTHAMRLIMEGKPYISPDVSQHFIGLALNSNYNGINSTPTASLTLREKEVLQLVAEGHTNKAIAVKLAVSKRTVEVHRNSLRNKLGLNSVAELTRFAINEGITSPIL